MKKNRSVAILIPLLFIGAVLLWYDIYLPIDRNSDKIVEFSVEKGDSVQKISINLEKQGLIKNAFIFKYYILFRNFSGKLQAGQYELSLSMSVPAIAIKIASGDTIKEKITIIEGWNIKDIKEYFEEKGIGSGEIIISPDLEGYLFPDTYQISADDKIEDIIKRIRDNFEKKLAPYRNEISGAGLTLSQVITMASLIEKEVQTPEDKKIVSGILWKRLKAGMPLQVDATISCITGKKTTDMSTKETQIDSPYNTYKYRGLPIGPICNPGLGSIVAAIYPEKSDFWYYLSTPEGKTIFSETLKEHNIAKAKYLK